MRNFIMTRKSDFISLQTGYQTIKHEAVYFPHMRPHSHVLCTGIEVREIEWPPQISIALDNNSLVLNSPFHVSFNIALNKGEVSWHNFIHQTRGGKDNWRWESAKGNTEQNRKANWNKRKLLFFFLFFFVQISHTMRKHASSIMRTRNCVCI